MCVLDPLFTLLYASPRGYRKPHIGGREEEEEGGGGGRASISPAQSALSGLAVTAGGQAQSSPKPLFIFPDVIIPPPLLLSVTEDYLFPPPLKCFFSLRCSREARWPMEDDFCSLE